MPGPRPVEGFESRSVQALPAVEPAVPGLWVVATASATRYVITVPPEGQPLVTRLAFYGWTFDWRPLISARAYIDDTAVEEPLRVAAEALITYVGGGRWARTTTVVSIDSYELAALLNRDEVQTFAENLMRRDAAQLVRDAVAAGRITTEEQLVQVCHRVGVPRDAIRALP